MNPRSRASFSLTLPSSCRYSAPESLMALACSRRSCRASASSRSSRARLSSRIWRMAARAAVSSLHSMMRLVESRFRMASAMRPATSSRRAITRTLHGGNAECQPGDVPVERLDCSHVSGGRNLHASGGGDLHLSGGGNLHLSGGGNLHLSGGGNLHLSGGGNLLDERGDNRGVEQAPGLAEGFQGRLARSRRRARGQVIVLVGDGENARADGDGVAAQAIGVATAVQSLMVMADHRRREGEDIEWSDELSAQQGMPALDDACVVCH